MRISADAGAWKIGAKKGRVCASRSTFPRMSKKLYIKTYGCQMNEYDSAKMSDVLAASHGLALVVCVVVVVVLLFFFCSFCVLVVVLVFLLFGLWCVFFVAWFVFVFGV